MTDSSRDSMIATLARIQSMRNAAIGEPRFNAQLIAVKRFQAGRLAKTYADLAATPRYAPAVGFFLDDLYGAKDFTRRDSEMLRIYPAMTKILPRSAIETVRLAVELDALTEELDQALTRNLAAKRTSLTEAAYVEAFRCGSTQGIRLHQLELVIGVGKRLDAVVERSFVHSTLKLLRRPAHLAGLGELQEFLESGFGAFRKMMGAAEFLDTIRTRETRVILRIFSGHPSPFSQLP